MRIPLLKRLNSVKPSDCLDIDGNKSILTDWKNPDTQENDTEKKEMNKSCIIFSSKLKNEPIFNKVTLPLQIITNLGFEKNTDINGLCM